MMDLVNTARAEVGVARLESSCDLVNYSRQRAINQSEQLSHDGAIYAEVLVRGPVNVYDAFDALMDSTPHRDIMLDPQYKRSAVGHSGIAFAQVFD